MDAADDLAYYLAEWYLPEMTETSVDDVVAKLDAAAVTVSSEGTPVRLVVTLSVPTDEVHPCPDVAEEPYPDARI